MEPNEPVDGEEGDSVVESLSEELLLAIFRHLGPRALVLGAGLVCKRWRRVSRDPRLWEGVTLECFGRAKELNKSGRRDLRLRLLRQAPCLGFLNLMTQHYSDEEVRLVAKVAPARIRRLYACFHKEHGLAELLPLLDKTRVHLRDLTVCRENNKDPDEVCEEFWEWFDSSSVERLTLVGTNLLDSVVEVDFRHRGTLQHLKSSTHASSGSVLAALIRAHCASLRSFQVKSFCCSWMSEIFSALARCRRLERIFVPSYPGITQLSACDGLTKVAVEDTHPEDPDGFADALRFLTAPNVAASVTVLAVHHIVGDHQSALYAALPKLGRLTAFAIDCCDRVESDVLAETLRKLPHLRKLSLLCVHNLTEDVLAAISAETVPGLRVLDLSGARCDDKGEPCWESCLDALRERLPQGVKIVSKPCPSHANAAGDGDGSNDPEVAVNPR